MALQAADFPSALEHFSDSTSTLRIKQASVRIAYAPLYHCSIRTVTACNPLCFLNYHSDSFVARV